MANCVEEEFDFISRCRHTKMYNSLPFHYHPTHKLYFLYKGKTRYFVGNELFLLEEGDMIFIPKGVHHKTASNGAPFIERLLISFDDSIEDEVFSEHIKSLYENKHIVFSQEQRYKIYELLLKMEKEGQEKYFREMRTLYFKELLLLISRYREQTRKCDFSESYALIQDAARYISNNYGSDLCLKSIAGKLI